MNIIEPGPQPPINPDTQADRRLVDAVTRDDKVIRVLKDGTDSHNYEAENSFESIWQRQREEVAQAVGRLLLPLAEVEPFARWSGAQLIFRLSESLSMSRTVLRLHLGHLSDRHLPLDEEGSSLRLATEKGQFFAQIVRVNEPIRDLPNQHSESEFGLASDNLLRSGKRAALEEDLAKLQQERKGSAFPPNKIS